jgi:hypothetical protein
MDVPEESVYQDLALLLGTSSEKEEDGSRDRIKNSGRDVVRG